eukprot:COSAG01_NODE_5200_length_4415_cov_3.887396_4_plen_91_part_00
MRQKSAQSVAWYIPHSQVRPPLAQACCSDLTALTLPSELLAIAALSTCTARDNPPPPRCTGDLRPAENEPRERQAIGACDAWSSPYRTRK